MSRSNEMIKILKEKAKKRNFAQSIELIISLQNIDTKKKELNINEVLFLPHAFTKPPTICVFASGGIALEARRSGADRVIEREELNKLATLRREVRKISQKYSFFLAEASLMPTIGKIFGPYLGPKGKMPSPVLPNTPIEETITKYHSAVRIRTRNQFSISCKIGDENIEDDKVAENASVVINAVKKKLPLGSKNIKNLEVKLTMGPPVELPIEV